ncbi:MAG: hypothetical protein J7K68_05850 [Candidatus Diapherotrites archaeon]|nr:hypothetical protein [Candidatus Diapherotrites archaeon]
MLMELSRKARLFVGAIFIFVLGSALRVPIVSRFIELFTNDPFLIGVLFA